MEKNKALEKIQLYQSVFGSPEGKKVLEDLMDKTGFLKNNYVPNDPHGTAFNDGATSIVRHILSTLKLDIKATREMLEKEYDEYD